MPLPPPEEQWVNVRLPGMGGWKSNSPASALNPNQLSDVQNMSYDLGFLSPREGSTLLYSKPSGETADELQTFTAKTSDGNEYLIAIYGASIYVYHETNSEWVKLNPNFTPSEVSTTYGWVNWNNGRGDDRVYLCNGVDYFMRFNQCVNQLNGAVADSATSIILDDATRFPTPSASTFSSRSSNVVTTTGSHGYRTGDMIFYDTDGTVMTGLTDGAIYWVIRVSATEFSFATSYANAIAGTAITLSGNGSGTQKFYDGNSIIIIQDSSSTIQVGYTAISGNTLTLPAQIGTAMADSASVVSIIHPRPDTQNGMQLGKLVAKHQQRLIVANYYGGETVIWTSVQSSPEDFTVAGTISGATTETIADGNGGITALHDFGAFLIVEKEDSIHSFAFTISDDIGSKLAVIQPIISGESFGTVIASGVVKSLNNLYYPTRTNGFIRIAPTGTGDSVSVDFEILSDVIDDYVRNKIDITNAVGASNDNKIVWAVPLKGATQNIVTLEYDLRNKTWAKHFGWAPKSFTVRGGDILYLDDGDGSVRKIYNGLYNDNNNPYNCSAYFPQFDFGQGSQTKTESLLYVEGYMTSASDFYIDVYFNEGGSLAKQTFNINKDTSNLSFSDPITDDMGSFILGKPMLGSVALANIADLRVFRCYLGIRISKQFYTLQPRVYSNKEAFYGITHLGFNPQLDKSIPQNFVIAPTQDIA